MTFAAVTYWPNGPCTKILRSRRLKFLEHDRQRQMPQPIGIMYVTVSRVIAYIERQRTTITPGFRNELQIRSRSGQRHNYGTTSCLITA